MSNTVEMDVGGKCHGHGNGLGDSECEDEEDGDDEEGAKDDGGDPLFWHLSRRPISLDEVVTEWSRPVPSDATMRG
eukprot:2858694-Prymnesium_polylepis.1